MKKTRMRIGSILLVFTLIMALLPVTAMASGNVLYLDENGTPTYTDSEIDVTEINSESAPEEWAAGWYVVTGNVTIATRITVTGDVHLILADDCELTAPKGISVTSGNSLTIYGQSKGTGKLTATANQVYGSAAIGGMDDNGYHPALAAHGNITINGGVITATGAGDAAGIGGAESATGTSGTITINGGNVTANGGGNAAGIGGGYANNVTGGDIVINGGDVTATGTYGGYGAGAGIGAGYSGAGMSITITDGTVNATGGSYDTCGGAGIGAGSGGSSGTALVSITITGGNVTANGGTEAAGIGGGAASNAKVGDIEITGGTVIATGGGNDTYGGAGIGAGGQGACGDITIGGTADITATGGTGTGTSHGGAGIGTGGGTQNKIGNITISGGEVTATGGAGSSSCGAGIGSGGNSRVFDAEYNPTPATGEITINAGIVTATGGGKNNNQADGIGNGTNGKSGDFSTGENGQAVIHASSISDNGDTNDWNGIIFQGNEGTVYGDVTLEDDLTLENGQTLKIPEGSSLNVPEGKKLTVQKNAELDVEEGGLLIVEEEGQLVNNGTLDNDGEVVVFGDSTGSPPTGNGLITNPVASYVDAGGTTHYYDDLAKAITAASASGGTVTLLQDTALTTAIREKVTLSVPANITLTIARENFLSLLASAGKIQVYANGAIIVDSTKMIGSDGNIQLKTGHIELSVKGDKLALAFAGANATVPGGKYWTLALDAGSSTVKMDVTLDSTSILTVNGTELRVANGSTLTNNGQITVGTLLTVRSEGTLTGGGTITNNGTIALCASDGKQAALGESTKITLNNNGKVLSQFDVADGKFVGQVTETTGSFSVTDGTNAALTFQYQYTPYVAPETPVTPVVPTTPSTSDKDDDDDDDGYSITIPASSSVRGGSISVNPRRADKGDTVTITVTPDDGYVLKDLTVTARSGGEVDLTKKNSTQYTFKMPAGAVVIEVSFAESDSAAEVEMSFADVPSDYWAVSEIRWAFDNGYMNGTSAATFNPGGTVSRQQVWMILARMAGADPADMSAAKAWAVEAGISDGTNPGGAVSRQQLVALLYRFAAQNGYDTSARADLSGYPDVASLASYAAEPMAWSVAGGIIGGTTQGTLNPAGTATRAQFAAILWRFYQTTAV